MNDNKSNQYHSKKSTDGEFEGKSPSDVKNAHQGEDLQKQNAQMAQLSAQRNLASRSLANLANKQQGVKKNLIKKGTVPLARAAGLSKAEVDNKLSSESGQKLLDEASQMGSVSTGVKYVVARLVLKKKMILVFFGGFFFLIIFAMLMMAIGKNSDSASYLTSEPLDEYKVLYEKLDLVVDEYQSEYGVELDKFLIISALTSMQENEKYSDSSDKDIEVDGEFQDENGETGIASLSTSDLENKVRLLAKYQIITNDSCSSDSSTKRAIASNDDEGIFDFWKSSVTREKNYDCSGGSGYTLSVEKGDIKDDNSGSAFFWNLVDEDFLKEYYSDAFEGLSGDNYEKKAMEYIDNIYMYADTLRELGDCDSYSNDNNFSTINIDCSQITVVGDNAGTYNLEEYVAGVLAHEFTPEYASGITGFSPSSSEIGEAMKVYAILARTYAINRTNSCKSSIENSQSAQTFKPTENANIWKAVNDTRGVVVTYDNDIFSTMYDSFGVENCDNEFCYADYKRLPTDEMHKVKVPKNWEKWFLSGSHHSGVSQLGVLYEATGEKKDYQTMIKGSYADGIEFKTLSGSANSNTSPYCERTLNNKGGTCDDSTFYDVKSIGEESLSSPMSLLTCMADNADSAFKTISNACGKIPHAGSLRNLDATVNAARSSTSFHYTGRAFDLSTVEGMQPGDSYFYVTLDRTDTSSNYYRLYCKTSSQGQYISNKTITPIKFLAGVGYTKKSPVTASFLDVTQVLNDKGIYGIGPRDCYKSSSMCLEWWHFQDTSGLVDGKTTFRQTLNQRFGSNYNYSNTPVAPHLNKRWNGGYYS